MSVPSKPLPTVKPFVAGIDIIADARSASSLANTGAPSPCEDFTPAEGELTHTWGEFMRKLRAGYRAWCVISQPGV